MSRLSVWLEAQWLAFRSYLMRHIGGWVVMACDDDMSDWHALAGGEAYGMDHSTGRFPDRDSARRFARYRNDDNFGMLFYVVHESTLLDMLPEKY